MKSLHYLCVTKANNMNTFTNIIEISSKDIFKMAHSGAQKNDEKKSYLYSLYMSAKNQHGTIEEKIEMALVYANFKTADEFDEAYDFIYSKLSV